MSFEAVFSAAKRRDFTGALWNEFMRAIDARLRPIEGQLDIQRTITNEVVARGLQVIEDGIGPAIAQAQAMVAEIEALQSRAATEFDAEADGLIALKTAELNSLLDQINEILSVDLPAIVLAADALRDQVAVMLEELQQGDYYTATEIDQSRLRFDAAQTLDATQKAQALANFGITGSAYGAIAIEADRALSPNTEYHCGSGTSIADGITLNVPANSSLVVHHYATGLPL